MHPYDTAALSYVRDLSRLVSDLQDEDSGTDGGISKKM